LKAPHLWPWLPDGNEGNLPPRLPHTTGGATRLVIHTLTHRACGCGYQHGAAPLAATLISPSATGFVAVLAHVAGFVVVLDYINGFVNIDHFYSFVRWIILLILGIVG
jgi:hypothetical protein